MINNLCFLFVAAPLTSDKIILYVSEMETHPICIFLFFSFLRHFKSQLKIHMTI